MKIFIGASIVFFLLGAAFTNDSFAQSSDTETVMQERFHGEIQEKQIMFGYLDEFVR